MVETVDHAKLLLDVSYNWEFLFDRKNDDEVQKIFSNKDFIGNVCKAVSSRIRGNISSKTFDDFHKNSHDLIKRSILKFDSENKLIPFKFKENNFFITDVNSSGYQPTDKETTALLQRSFKVSLDIQTKSKEAEAAHQSARLEQEASG